MLLTNNLADYTQREIKRIGARINKFVETLAETDLLLEEEIQNPSAPDEGNNVLHFNSRPITEFTALANKEFPLHELVDIYTRWNDILWNLAHNNKGHYKNEKLVSLLLNIRYIVATFANFFNKEPKDPKNC